MRRLLIAALGLIYVVVTIPLAEAGGNILGGSCNEPETAEGPVCRVIFPGWVDAWQVIPIGVVAVIVVAAVAKRSYRLGHASLLTALGLTLVLPLLMAEFVLP